MSEPFFWPGTCPGAGVVHHNSRFHTARAETPKMSPADSFIIVCKEYFLRYLRYLTVQAAWTSGWPGRERLPVRSHTVSSVKLGRSLELPPKSEANVMKSSRNLDSSEETEVNVQSANIVIGLLQVIAGDRGSIYTDKSKLVWTTKQKPKI